MTVSVSDRPLVVSGATSIALSTIVQVTGGSGNPAYLVLNGFDRNEYAAGASGATGLFSGAGQTLGLTTTDDDARETGIVFAYQSSSGRYYSSTYGYLDQLTYTASSSTGDVTDLSLWGFGSRSQANAYAADGYTLMQYDTSGYLGSTSVVTRPGFGGGVPTQATPDGIAAVADGFVGQAWNMDGCWVLASTIAAEAGAALPIQSTADIAGQGDGEWFVAFNGPAGSTGNWQSMVRTGDVIGFITGAGGGHITTCVSGSGGTAALVDNMTVVNGGGSVVNGANDGSSADISILSPHAASVEWSGVAANSVVIYRLDTPVVTAMAGSVAAASGTMDGLASLVSAADPAGRTVTEYQAYLANGDDVLLSGGVATAATSAATAVTAASLGQLAVEIGGGTDTLTVRAFNGAYWGDWTSVTLTGTGTAPSSPSAAPAAPSTATTTTTPTTPNTSPSGTASTGGNPATEPVYRFYEQTDGTHFFTASTAEANALLASRPDLVYEGVGLDALTSSGADPAAEPVYRFFNVANGSHFYTASAAEANGLISGNAAYSFEGVAFYEDASNRSGDLPVYRFFDTGNDTHFLTESAAERASILATRPDLVPEGIAFYAPA